MPRVGTHVRVRAAEEDWYGVFMGFADDATFDGNAGPVEAFRVAVGYTLHLVSWVGYATLAALLRCNPLYC